MFSISMNDTEPRRWASADCDGWPVALVGGLNLPSAVDGVDLTIATIEPVMIKQVSYRHAIRTECVSSNNAPYAIASR